MVPEQDKPIGGHKVYAVVILMRRTSVFGIDFKELFRNKFSVKAIG